MAELTTTKLNAESHLLLDQPLLRMPYELSRRTFKNAQRYLEHSTKELTTSLSATTKQATKSSDPSQTLESIDSMISKMTTLKRKLETLQEEERKLNKSHKARIRHLQDLFEVKSLVDVKYDEWSRIRLARLLVDYLLREGYSESAAHLAASKGISDLVDVDAFIACHKIEHSLREGHRTAEALAWCKEHQQNLKKVGSGLEFELRLQQYIELVRQGHEAAEKGDGEAIRKLVEATKHARKYFEKGTDPELFGRAAGLLAFKPWVEIEPYASLYSPSRWEHLAQLFLTTHHSLYSLPPRPLLHIALSAGLSALKTPSCHSAYTSSSANSASSTTTVCPICSTELNELARNVPYALHTKSIVESDPVVLPNGRIYGRERLKTYNEKVGPEPGWIRDPAGGLNGERWPESEIRKVFIM
ncbi:CTLH/CRA C-terminal to lish motif domain-containing protein [Lophiotrema nucula]|uniref:CTLH/CRA C-terminal to lish motif domain-containing protein n=1 Tax=Lophiotrema nucula TaxID=690887 RepID=A0A6A5Z6Q0_9PLEO|nr:CTLH/CRA C-terminal to lish motif domain-containing protein [Lophiotrema nucula]